MSQVINFKSKRHQEYKRNWNIYKDNPDFKQTKGKYIKIPLGKEICHLFRDVGFKDNVQASVKDNVEANTALDRISFNNRLDSILSEMAVTVAAKGEAVIKNSLDNGASRISIVQPEYYFPEFDKFDQRKVIRETIAIPFVENEESFIYQEIYERREDGYFWCISKTSYYTNDEVGADIEFDELNTYLRDSPLTHVVYMRNNGSFFGTSIFDGIYDLLEEYNWRVSQISKILDAHSNPSIVGSANLLDKDYKFNKTESGLFIPIDEGEEKPEYLTWESQLSANFQFIDEIIMKALHYVSILNPSLYGLTKEAANSSAKAIKLKAFRTSSVIENSLKHWEYALKKVLFLAQQIEVLGGNYNYTPALPSVEISPSMPFDSFDMVQEEQLKLVSGNTSVKSSIARLNPHYNATEVEEEFLEIINERNEINSMTFQGSSLLDE